MEATDVGAVTVQLGAREGNEHDALLPFQLYARQIERLAVVRVCDAMVSVSAFSQDQWSTLPHGTIRCEGVEEQALADEPEGGDHPGLRPHQAEQNERHHGDPRERLRTDAVQHALPNERD